jgi:hypothetical protein
MRRCLCLFTMKCVRGRDTLGRCVVLRWKGGGRCLVVSIIITDL